MFKKLPQKTNFILIGMLVGFFIGMTIQQVVGTGETPPDNITVNSSGSFANGLVVAQNDMLVPNGSVGIGTTTPTEALTIAGTAQSSEGLCIGSSCIASWDDLSTMLGTNAGTINGECSTTAQETCTSGTYSDRTDTDSNYQWMCLGSGSPVGTDSPLCHFPIQIFTATPNPVPSGTSSTLSWSINSNSPINGAELCFTSWFIDGGIFSTPIDYFGKYANTGTASTGNLTTDTTYTIYCKDFVGRKAVEKSVTVTVAGTGTSTYNLTVTKAGTGTGTVSSSPTGTSFASGTSVTLTAVPDSGSSFTGWSGACSGTATTCNLSMTENKSVTATFTAVGATTYPLTVTVSGTGMGNVNAIGYPISCHTVGYSAATNYCSSNFAPGTSVILRVSPPDSTGVFDGWSGGGCTGKADTCTVTMNQAQNVTATFTANSAGAPTVTLDPFNPSSITVGQSATISFTSTNATSCSGTGLWNGDLGGTFVTNHSTGAMNTAGTFTQKITCTGPGGTASSVTQTLTVSSLPLPVINSFTASPNTVASGASAVLSWSANTATTLCNMTGGIYNNTYAGGATGTLTTGNLTATTTYTVNCTNGVSWASKTITVTVTGSATTYPLNVTISGTGMGYVNAIGYPISCHTVGLSAVTNYCSSNFAPDTSVILHVTLLDSTTNVFDGWSGGGCTGKADTCTVTMNQAQNVTATFTAVAETTYPLNVTVSPDAGGIVFSPSGTFINCGEGNTKCSANLSGGSTIVLQENPAAGYSAYTFTGWSGGGCAGTAKTCIVTMSQAQNVTATFTATTATPLSAPTNFTASCSYNTSTAKYAINTSWSSVSGAINYPIRLRYPTYPTPPDINIGMGAVGDGAPTGTTYTFSDLNVSGTYKVWVHAWNNNGWSSNPMLDVNCAPVTSSPTVTLDPFNPSSITVGQSATISFTSTNATSCSGTGLWNGDLGGTFVTNHSTGAMNTAGTFTQKITCTGPGGTASSVTQTLTVSSLPLPVINSFTASPNTVASGASAVLSWSANTATTLCNMTGGIYNNTYAGGATGTLTTGNLTATTTYTVNCTNGVSWASKTITVTVSGTGGTTYTCPVDIVGGIGTSNNCVNNAQVKQSCCRTGTMTACTQLTTGGVSVTGTGCTYEPDPPGGTLGAPENLGMSYAESSLNSGFNLGGPVPVGSFCQYGTNPNIYYTAPWYDENGNEIASMKIFSYAFCQTQNMVWCVRGTKWKQSCIPAP